MSKRKDTEKEVNEPKKKRVRNPGGSVTFARRYKPSSSFGAAKWDAIRNAFVAEIKPLLNKLSEHEARFFFQSLGKMPIPNFYFYILQYSVHLLISTCQTCLCSPLLLLVVLTSNHLILHPGPSLRLPCFRITFGCSAARSGMDMIFQNRMLKQRPCELLLTMWQPR